MTKLLLSTAMFFPRMEDEWIELTSDLEFDGYEIMPQDITECKFEYYKDLKTKIGNKKIYSFHFPLVLMGFFHNPYPKAIKTGRKIMEDLIKSAREVEAKDIVIHSGASKIEEHKKTTIENIKYLSNIAENEEIYIDLENTKRGDCNTPKKLIKKINLINKDYLVPMLDVTEAKESDEEPVDFVKKLPQLRHIHLSDHKNETPHLPLGSGDILWEEFFKSLKDNSFEGNLVLELSYRYLMNNPKKKLEQSINFIKDHLQ